VQKSNQGKEILCTKNPKNRTLNPEKVDQDSAGQEDDVQLQSECPFQVKIQQIGSQWRVCFYNSFHNHVLKKESISDQAGKSSTPDWPLKPVENNQLSKELQ